MEATERRGTEQCPGGGRGGSEEGVSGPRLLEREQRHSPGWSCRTRNEFGGERVFGLEACGLRCLGTTGTSAGGGWEAMAKLKGLVCDFRARWGRRGFSGHSEPTALRRHLQAGQLFQPSARLALNGPAHARRARALHMHRQAGGHIPRVAPGGVSKPLCPRSLQDTIVLSLGFRGNQLFKLYVKETQKPLLKWEDTGTFQCVFWNLQAGDRVVCRTDHLQGTHERGPGVSLP